MKYFPVVLLAISVCAPVGALADDRADYCAGIAEYSQQLMFIRQMGQSMESQMRSALYKFDSEADQAAAQALVQEAWAVELNSTSKKQQKQIKRFGESTEEACLAGKIFPA